MGHNINNKQVVNTGGGESGNEHKDKDSEVSDNDNESLQLDYISG